MNHESFYYFVDDKINKTYQKSHLMRTEVLFGAPLPGYTGLRDHREEQTDLFKEFVITYIDLLSKASTDKVQVLYGGNELFDYEVESTFWADVRMAVYACIAIALFMFILTSFSIYLTFMGILCIVLSFPLAFFFYRVVFNILALGILNGAAAFVIIGIGVDDVFVFINIFRQTTHMKSVNGRLAYTIKTAGVATFFTSFTTSVAFAANIASSIPAVYEFGLFMSLIVGCCWVTVFLLMPPTLYIYALWFEALEHMCGNLCCHCLQKQEGSVPLDAQQLASPVSSALQLSGDDDDVPLIQMEEDAPASGNDNDDVPMLVPPANDTSPADPQAMESVSSSSIGRFQQYVLGMFVEKVVIRFRIPIIVTFVLLLGASIGCMTQLRPSDHPPQLFEPDTNLQRLLDLKANFSIIDTLRCDHCSALYKVGRIKNITPKPPTGEQAKSVDAGYNVCKRQNCGQLKDRPIMQSGATVYVVFGIKGFTREEMHAGHVLADLKGKVIFDKQFADEVDIRVLDKAMICLVVAVFYVAGWQMGAVEAVSLSILVGSSVDYCMHLVEGYLLVGKQIPQSTLLSASQARQWRTTSAVRHIGASIISSALTTIMAAVPLTQTTIQPFAKFGSIVLINSTVSITFTLTLCVALLTTFAPARFVSTWRSHGLAFVITAAVCGAIVLALYICSTSGVFIPGPNGEPLFG
nr:hypothetical protein BaRGS_005197 [Batillaria attramentaria]